MTDSERMSRPLSAVDPEIYEAIQHEVERQHSRLELIASENFTSEAVLQATGSVFTNKYAEGYPGKRYYGGCEFTDVVETLARERAKKLFGAEYVNVQPHSGSQANQAAYAAVLQPGDIIMGMNLAHGGHLTHGHPLNFSGKTYHVVPYGVRHEDERIDYDEVARLAEEHKPKLIIAGGSAYPRILDFARFRKIADAVGAIFLVDMAHISGLVAAGLHPNPCEYADIVTSTTHKTLRGPRSGMILAKAKYGAAIDKALFPGHPGRTAGARDRGQGGMLSGSDDAGDSRRTQKQVIANAQALAAGLQQQGFRVVSGGTDTHLMLVDVFSKGVRGKEAETALDEAYITVNKNAIPFDVNPPLNPSGIRSGQPGGDHARIPRGRDAQVAALIAEVLSNVQSQENAGFGAAARDGVGGALPAVRLEAGRYDGVSSSSVQYMPLQIALDTRRLADFGIGTYIRNLVRALARIDSENQYTLITAEQPDAGIFRSAGEFPDGGLPRRQAKRSGAGELWPVSQESSGVDLYHIPSERGAAHDAEAVCGDHSRHEHAAVREPDRATGTACGTFICGAACCGRIA